MVRASPISVPMEFAPACWTHAQGTGDGRRRISVSPIERMSKRSVALDMGDRAGAHPGEGRTRCFFFGTLPLPGMRQEAEWSSILTSKD
jgi:hypothetical protein